MRKESKLQIMPPTAGYYPVDDMPLYIEKIMDLTKPKKRKLRDDLKHGVVCIVADGQFISKKVIYIGNKKNDQNYLAVCIGPSSINDVGIFAIDERHLFKTNYVFNLAAMNISDDDLNKIAECNMSLIHTEKAKNYSEFEKGLELNILKQVAQVKHLKSYLQESFRIPEGDAMSYKF